MQSNRTDFEAGFALLGVNPNPAVHYPGAVTYARQFKKCSILTEVNVRYSSNTSAISLNKKVDNK